MKHPQRNSHSTNSGIVAAARFGCATRLASPNEVTFSSVSWDYCLTSLVALASVALFCTHALPKFPETIAEVVIAIVTALMPMLWAPYLLGLMATPDCPDTAVLLDRGTVNLTLPSGISGHTTEHTVIDEAVRVVALGIVLTGCGSAALVLYLVADTVADTYRDGVDAPASLWTVNVDARLHTVVVMVALFLYVGGGIAVHDADQLDSDNWSNDGANSGVVRDACTTGTGAVYDRDLAAESRDAFTDLDVSTYSIAVVTLLAALTFSVYSFVIDMSEATASVIIAICGTLFAVVHCLVTITLSQAVYIGSNPVCAQATLANDVSASQGLVTMAYSCVGIAFYAIVATPYFSFDEPMAHKEDSQQVEVCPLPAVSSVVEPPSSTQDIEDRSTVNPPAAYVDMQSPDAQGPAAVYENVPVPAPVTYVVQQPTDSAHDYAQPEGTARHSGIYSNSLTYHDAHAAREETDENDSNDSWDAETGEPRAESSRV